jgi:hypothetical protein
MDLLTGVNDLGLKVDVLPAQAKDLTAAQAIEEQRHKCRVERIINGGLEEGEGFGW